MGKVFFLLLPLIYLGTLFASENGTLVVSYKSDEVDTGLDHVRFWVWDQEQRHLLFPRGDAYIEDPNSMGRMVVIEDIPPGDYVVEFMIPNRDGDFVEPPPQAIEVQPGEVAKVDASFLKTDEDDPIVMVTKAAPPSHHETPGFLFLTFATHGTGEISYLLKNDETKEEIDGPREGDIVQPMGSDIEQVLIQNLTPGSWHLTFYQVETGKKLLQRTLHIRSNETCFTQEEIPL